MNILPNYILVSYKLRYNLLMKIYIIWLIGVIIWNFGFPNATPIADVIVAILLSFLSIGLKKYLKL